MFGKQWDVCRKEESIGHFSVTFHGSRWNIVLVMDEPRNGPLRNGGNFRPIFSIKKLPYYSKCAPRCANLVVYCGFPTKSIISSCEQAALQMVFSVCLSVRLYVRPSVTPFWLYYYQWQKWRPSKRSRSEVKVKLTEVTTQLYRFWTVTPVRIHVWWWNDAYSLIMFRRGALLFLKVICQISRSHSSKNRRIWPRFGVSGL